MAVAPVRVRPERGAVNILIQPDTKRHAYPDTSSPARTRWPVCWRRRPASPRRATISTRSTTWRWRPLCVWSPATLLGDRSLYSNHTFDTVRAALFDTDSDGTICCLLKR